MCYFSVDRNLIWVNILLDILWTYFGYKCFVSTKASLLKDLFTIFWGSDLELVQDQDLLQSAF